MSNEVIIRHASLKDAQAYRELRLQALKNHPDAFGMDYEDAKARPEDYWENTLKVDPQEKAVFFAFSQDKLIGMTGIYKGRGKKEQHGGMIWGVYVRPKWRGLKISESFIRSCLKWAKDQGLAIVKLAVVTTNQPAIRCYERCGFTTYGTEPKALCHDGRYYDEYLMAIEIDSKI